VGSPAERLRTERDEVAARATALRGELDGIIASASSTTGDDEHDPEGATIGFERAQAASLLAAAERRLAAIDAALGRVAAGKYGRCERCGGEIGAERLEARPDATLCVTCAATRR
jgi:RNA polymerase-binding transcription factor DksA